MYIKETAEKGEARMTDRGWTLLRAPCRNSPYTRPTVPRAEDRRRSSLDLASSRSSSSSSASLETLATENRAVVVA